MRDRSETMLNTSAGVNESGFGRQPSSASRPFVLTKVPAANRASSQERNTRNRLHAHDEKHATSAGKHDKHNKGVTHSGGPNR